MNVWDGIRSMISGIANKRNAVNTNAITGNKIDDQELREILRTGLGSKVVRLKVGAALSDAIQFNNDDDKKYYNKHLAHEVQRAAKFMLAFGRGIVIIYKRGDDLSKPIGSPDSRYVVKAFSGDMVTVHNVSRNLMSEMYNKPLAFMVNAETIHHSRVIDFTYVEPSEYDLPIYKHGGVSEFELIYPQLIQDGIIERATPAIIDKNSSLFYKVKGFKNALRQKKEGEIQEFYSEVEGMRSIMGATIIDDEDSIEVHAQQLTNLSDVDRIGLRRLAMVTGIPLPYLVGEAVQGLNSTGDNERSIWGDTIKHIQSGYLITPLNSLCFMLGLGEIEFIKAQGSTDKELAEIKQIHVANAVQLAQIGQDYAGYLVENNVVAEDDLLLTE